ncbi:MAG TPA: hypothetical protein VNK43_11735 [Gemmatimonadales bacterium]|nr:hypothetical protein [Gemmatimonadales bacterium]
MSRGGADGTPVVRIAMWSGPRNISTALLRAWENRPDTVVVDEPFYAYYLTRVPVDHPGRDEVIAHHETDWRRVVAELLADLPSGRTIFYQKHMAHHLLPEIDRGWLERVTNVFLVRDPREMIVSLARKMGPPTLRDTGLPQQLEIFRAERARTGRTPPVIDAADVLRDPRRALGALCEALGVPFLDAMLSWPPGRRSTDGIWAKYWYDAVERSTGFEPYVPGDRRVPPELRPLADECMAYYDELREERLR